MLALVVSAGQLGQALALRHGAPAAAAQRAGPPLRAHAPLRVRARRRARAPAPRTSARSSSASRRSTTRRWCSSSPARARGCSRWPNARCSAASRPSSGASAALFVSDEKTEVFLRDQRRSKAHRALVPDPGAPCDEVISVDLGGRRSAALRRDRPGAPGARSRRQAGEPGHSRRRQRGHAARHARGGACCSSRSGSPRGSTSSSRRPRGRCSKSWAQAGALVDLIATGARIIEPDRRVVTGEIYPPRARCSSRFARAIASPRPAEGTAFVVASAETLAYAVATGSVGDPRSFKRPVRVTVPRALPTDDVLILRERRPEAAPAKRPPSVAATSPGPALAAGANLELVEGCRRLGAEPKADCALFLSSLDEVRQVAAASPAKGPSRRSSPRSSRAASSPFSQARDPGARRRRRRCFAVLKGQKSLALSPGRRHHRRRRHRHHGRENEGQPLVAGHRRRARMDAERHRRAPNPAAPPSAVHPT